MSAVVLAALSLPANARVDQRVPKKLLLERSDPTAADKRQIQDGIEELVWVAALKPTNIGVPEYRDESRSYIEVAVLSLTLRPEAKMARLVELVHRSIPYPVLLVAKQDNTAVISLAHKRQAQNDAALTVLDGTFVSTPGFAVDMPAPIDNIRDEFLINISVAVQPKEHLYALYQGWIARVEAYLAAHVTGRFAPADLPDVVTARREALELHARLQREIAALRIRAEKESQINRRVELNQSIKRLEAELVGAIAKL